MNLLAFEARLFTKVQAMKGKRSARSENHDSDEGGERVVAENLEGQAVLGDVIWVKHCGNSWWPALVCDVKCLLVLCSLYLEKPFLWYLLVTRDYH